MDEQTAGFAEISSSINLLSDVSQQNAASSEEMAASADKLLESATALKNAISFFQSN